MKYLAISMCMACLIGCTVKTDDLSGLWQLEEVYIDGLKKATSPILLDLKDNQSFAVSEISGDQIGTYQLRSGRLLLRGQKEGWFNNRWVYRHFEKDVLRLVSPELGPKNTKLEFKRIDKVPDFQLFENKVLGKWKLYKIRKGDLIEQLHDIRLTIDEKNNYIISQEDQILESGKTVIDTRHRKIIFENGAIPWRAWFYGEELRLNNDFSNIQYCLRKEN